MKRNRAIYAATDRNGNPVTYGFDLDGPFLEVSENRDRTAIYGNSPGNLERMRQEISQRGILVPFQHLHLFRESMELAA